MIGSGRRRLRRHRAARPDGAGNRERRLPWLILGGALLFGAVLAILLGTLLGKRAEGLPAGGGEVPVTYGKIQVPAVSAEAFAFGYAVDNMKANGTVAVSVVLRDRADSLTYRSGTAIHMGRQADGSQNTDAGFEIAYLHENDMYVCGVFSVLSAELDGESRSAEAYYERSLAAEISDAGIDAILFDGLPFAEDEEETLAYLASFRSSVGNAAIGAVLPADFFTDGNKEATLRRYLRSADFFALDLRGITDTEQLGKYLENATYCLRAFPVRLLINRSDEVTRKLLTESGYTDFQMMP